MEMVVISARIDMLWETVKRKEKRNKQNNKTTGTRKETKNKIKFTRSQDIKDGVKKSEEIWATFTRVINKSTTTTQTFFFLFFFVSSSFLLFWKFHLENLFFLLTALECMVVIPRTWQMVERRETKKKFCIKKDPVRREHPFAPISFS